MKKIKVLIFANSFRVGGSERQAVELAKGLDRSRFDPVVVCFQAEGPLAQELPSDVADVPAFSLEGFVSLTGVKQAIRFVYYLKEKRIDVVQCFDFYSNVFAIPLARLARVRVILGARREEVATKTPFQQRAQRWSYRLATGVVANAEAMKEQVLKNEGLDPRKVWIIHNGLNLSRFDQHAANRDLQRTTKPLMLTIAVIANLRPEKGHGIFLSAAQELRNRCGQVRFVIAGDGPMRNDLNKTIQMLGLSDCVQMLGAVKDVPALLRSVDIAVLPSLKNEGFPNAVMEAMAASLPVVATDTGGTRELVVDGYTGFVVPAGESAALAEPLFRLCNDSELRRKMGEAGRLRIAQFFSTEKMVSRFEDLYAQLMA